MDGCLQGCSFTWWLFLLLMISDRVLHVSNARFCKASEGTTPEFPPHSSFFFFVQLMFLFSGATLHPLLWLLLTLWVKKNSRIQSFSFQTCKWIFVLRRCQETFYVFKIYAHTLLILIMFLVSNKMEGQYRRKYFIVFCTHVI